MCKEAKALGLKINDELMNLFPSPAGIQHDACATLPFKIFRKIDRPIRPDAVLDPSVIDRFKLPEVWHYDCMKAYRPPSLRFHQMCAHFFEADELIAAYGNDALERARQLVNESVEPQLKDRRQLVLGEIERRIGHTQA
jgi:hypothetical protein